MPATSEISGPRLDPAPALRRCIASGEVRPRDQLLRFVVGPDGTLVADAAGRLPGRGMWLSPRRDVLERACARNLFAKAARANIRLPDDLAAQTERALRRRCLDLVGLARRSGVAVAGFEKVKARLVGGKAALLLQAANAAADGRRKIASLARARHPGLQVVTLFTAEELGQALGRGATVHLLLLPGGLCDRVRAEVARLEGLVGPAVGGPRTESA